MPAIKELSELLKGIPKGSWVALSRNEESVIAYAATLEQVLEKAKEDEKPLVQEAWKQTTTKLQEEGVS